MEEKKIEANDLVNSSSQHLNNQSQATISQAHGATEYHGIKVEHLPNY